MDLTTIFAQHRTRNIVFALVSFLISFVVYTLTVAPTTSFWDPGEYIAISHTLQVAHPPGSPFFALWGRLFSMFVPSEYVALSINMISVLTSALSIMLLYLIIVRLIQEWKGPADTMDRVDLLGLYGGGLLGALSFTFTHTQWFNAVEAEMYASSLFFTALVVWMALRWSENHEQPWAERWLILIAYIFGLGIGVHLLNLLALFFVAMIIYFKRYQFSIGSFILMALIAMVCFLVIFPFTIIMIPDLADDINRLTYGMIGPLFYMLFILVAVIAGIWYTHKRRVRLLNLAMLIYTVILIGYSSYALVFIRSQAEPPIDENDPSTVEAFVSYLKREQYGQTPLLTGYTYDNRTGSIDRENEVLFPRRYSPQPSHMEYYSRFSSDWQYFWQYQVMHMYVRYFNWNFIGREADIQDAGWYSGFGETPHSQNPANTGYFYLPLLFGLLGMFYHFRNDWKRALAVLVLFLMTGLAIIVYLNQTPMEPRERDYAYAGSFFAFSIWLGMGGTAIIEMIRQWIGDRPAALWSALAVMFLAIPAWMASENWESQDRSNNYVARDYAWNLLHSVEPNAILFTNGDNDTFPLWYLQEVEGVRTDVRVVNLSLLNTGWYIRQMRDRQAHESLPLPIRMTDEQIDEMTGQLTLHTPGDEIIPVDKQLLRYAFSDNPSGEPEGVIRDDVFENQLQSAVPFSIPVDSLDDEVRWHLEGRFAGQDPQGNRRYYLQVQDRMVLELLENSQWMRPVYFANTVSSQGLLELHPYFQYEGKAYRVVPKRRDSGRFGYLDPEVHIDRLKKFRFEEWNNPDVYFDENIRRMLTNYRYAFTQLADELMKRGDREEAVYWLTYGEEKIPFRQEELDWTVPALYAYRYARLDAHDQSVELAEFVKDQIIHWLEWDLRELDDLDQQQIQLENQVAEARARARSDRQRSLQVRLNTIASSRQSRVDQISMAVSQLTILQRVYYLADMDQQAEELATRVNLLTDGRIPMATTREENEAQIERFNLGI